MSTDVENRDLIFLLHSKGQLFRSAANALDRPECKYKNSSIRVQVHNKYK